MGLRARTSRQYFPAWSPQRTFPDRDSGPVLAGKPRTALTTALAGLQAIDFVYNKSYDSGMSQRTIESFLVDAFATIEATSTAVGRVLVGPNDAATSDESDRAGLADELVP